MHINNKIQEISKKLNNNNIVFDKEDKIIQRLKKDNHLLKKKIKENKDYKKNKSRTKNYALDNNSNYYNIDSSNSNYFIIILTEINRKNGHNMISQNTSRRLQKKILVIKQLNEGKLS